MHIRDVFAREKSTWSFEFFPPKTAKGAESLLQAVHKLESLRPDFVSVTYGAGGSTRQQTHDLVMRLKDSTNLDPVPHLTCVCHTEQEIAHILEQYAKQGISNIMALHGDPPATAPNYNRSDDVFRYAIDLVKFTRRFGEDGGHTDPRGFGIGVAGFPEGHPDTPNRLAEMDHLKAKVDAGADYVCTQMFFDNRMYYDWCERCELAGIRVPLVAGVMPITSTTTLKRMAELSGGTRFPAPLLKQLERCGDDAEAVKRVGTHWATEQCRDLIDHGVGGIHFYTLNQSDASKQIYKTLGAKDSAALR